MNFARYREITRILNMILDLKAPAPSKLPLWNALIDYRSNPSPFNRDKLLRIVNG